MIHPPPATCLTTHECHRYVSSRHLFEHLLERYQLTPIYTGKGGKTILYRTAEIETALAALRLNGGYDETTGKPIPESTHA